MDYTKQEVNSKKWQRELKRDEEERQMFMGQFGVPRTTQQITADSEEDKKWKTAI